jgi:hypothetical protein
MNKPVIKAAFQDEIARVQRNERVLQQVYAARLHAGDANRAVDTAKVALADAVIASGGCYTRADIVQAVEFAIREVDRNYEAKRLAEEIVDQLLI